ncbi:MAG: MFS transporter, partial [Thermoleophilia bacterium]|nr:MFS transporter [Thermoleophilia bacterium]
LMPAGRIADLVGRKRIFIVGIALFTFGSAACAASPSLGTLIAARAVQGGGAALMIPTSLALLLPAFPPERRPLAIGAWGASNAVAAAVGPGLGGGLVEIADWRLVFLINLPIGLVSLLAAARGLDEYRVPGAERLPDLAGTVALTAGIGLVILGIVEGNNWGWSSTATLAAFAGGAALAGATVIRSRRHPVPAIETSLWRIDGFAGVNVGSFAAGVAFFAFFLGGTLFLTSIWRYSVLDAGLAMSTGAASSAVFSPIGGVLMGRVGERIVVFVGGLLFAGACFWMASKAQPQPDFLGVFLPGGILVGAGLGLVFPALAGAAVKGMPPERLGGGIAMNMTARQIGGAIGVALLVALLTAGGNPYDRFIQSWVVCGAVAAATAVLGLWLIPKGTGRHATAAETDRGNISAPSESRTISSVGSKS